MKDLVNDQKVAHIPDLTNGRRAERKPEHYIKFGDFNSFRFGLHMHAREAITPTEKEVTASIPYRQGVVDFSNLFGARMYNNRTITYVFYCFDIAQTDVSLYQTTIENLLMRGFDQELHDSSEPQFHYACIDKKAQFSAMFHYRGKCKEVIVEDDYAFRRLRVQITFDLYPFKISNHPESMDLFDAFNFELDAFQDDLRFDFAFEANPGAEPEETRHKIVLYNAGKNVLSPTVTATLEPPLPGRPDLPMPMPAFLEKDGIEHRLISGSHQYPRLYLRPGMNEIYVRGWSRLGSVVTVAFDWKKEWI